MDYQPTQEEYRALRQRLAALNIIADFNLKLSLTLNPNQIEQIIFETVTYSVGAQQCGLINADDTLSCRVTSPFNHHEIIEHHPPPECPARQVLECKEIYLWDINSSLDGQTLPCMAIEGGVTSYIGIPLLAGDKMVGVLEAFNLANPENHDQAANLLTSLAIPASLALRNANLYAHLMSEKDRVVELELTMQNLFRTYLPESVADMLVANPEMAQPGGERREVTIMFADLEGFTNLSENREPEEVVTILNEVLAGMTSHILDQGGTVDKFLGDGVMAVFNAPMYQEDHAYYAVLAALEIRQFILGELELPLQINIGIHTGEAVIGNIGDTQLLNYTAIGDTVNIASRLQDIANGGQILISEKTYSLVKDRIRAVFLGERQVKGRQGHILTYGVRHRLQEGQRNP